MGPFDTAEFALVTGTTTPIELEQGDPHAAPSDFVGPIVLPSEPFLIEVTGVDLMGSPYRIESELFHPQSIEVRFDPTSMSRLLPGTTAAFRFEAINHGAESSFRVTAPSYSYSSGGSAGSRGPSLMDRASAATT